MSEPWQDQRGIDMKDFAPGRLTVHHYYFGFRRTELFCKVTN